MAEVEIRLKTSNGYYAVNRFNGLKSFETTSQSTADPKNISYGLLANAGSAKVIDIDGTIAQMIEDGTLGAKNVPTEIYVNGNKIQQHITSNSDYSAIDKILSLEFTNDIENLYSLSYKFPLELIKTPSTLKDILLRVFSDLDWVNNVDYTLDTTMISATQSVKTYLDKFEVKYPYFLSDNVGDVINTICQVAQLNAIKDRQNRLIFINAVPRRNALEEIQIGDNPTTSIIHIPRKMQISRPEGSLFREGQVKNIEYSPKAISENIEAVIDQDYNLLDSNGNLDLSALGAGAELLTSGGHTYLCFIVKFNSNNNELDYFEYLTLNNELVAQITVNYTDTFFSYTTDLPISPSSLYIEDVDFDSMQSPITELTNYKGLTNNVFVIKHLISQPSLTIKSVNLKIRARKYTISTAETKSVNDDEECLPFANNELTSVDTVFDNDLSIYEFWAENTIDYLEEGIRTLKLSVYAGDYYEDILNGSDNLLVDFHGQGQVIDVGQDCYIDNDNAKNSAYKYLDGKKVVWRATASTLRYEGACYTDLQLQECRDIAELERLAAPEISISGNILTISAPLGVTYPNSRKFEIYVNNEVVITNSTSAQIYLPHYVSSAGSYIIYAKVKATGYARSKRSNRIIYNKATANETWVFNQLSNNNFPATFGNDYAETVDYEVTSPFEYQNYFNSYSSMKFHYEILTSGRHRNDVIFGENQYVYQSTITTPSGESGGWLGDRFKTITFAGVVDTSTTFGQWVSSNATKQ